MRSVGAGRAGQLDWLWVGRKQAVVWSEERVAFGCDMATALAELRRRLQARGVRLTPQREAIALSVLGARHPLSAQEIHDVARTIRPELGLTTVYRTLELLAEVGAIRRIHGEHHCEGFVAAAHKHGHAVVCSLCGRTKEFTDCRIEALAEAAAAETGFAIADHFLQFSGVCSDCQLRRVASGAEDAVN